MALAATRVTLGDDVSVVIFVDQTKNIKGYFRVSDGTGALAAVNHVFIKIGDIYQEQAKISAQKGLKYPAYKPTIRRIDEYLGNLSENIN